MLILPLLLWLVFLGFFFCLLPLSIYLFAKLFPVRYPRFIGFPDNPARGRDPARVVRSDDPAA
jgi:hypothetical protein